MTSASFSLGFLFLLTRLAARLDGYRRRLACTGSYIGPPLTLLHHYSARLAAPERFSFEAPLANGQRCSAFETSSIGPELEESDYEGYEQPTEEEAPAAF